MYENDSWDWPYVLFPQESSERLFNKGEMNSYLDHHAFTRSIWQCLVTVLQLTNKHSLQLTNNYSSQLTNNYSSQLTNNHSSQLTNSDSLPLSDCPVLQTLPHEHVSQIFHDTYLIDFLEKSALSLVSELSSIMSKCCRSDCHLNPVRYACVFQAVSRAEIWLVLMGEFTERNPHLTAIAEAMKTLDLCTAQCVEEMQLTRSFFSTWYKSCVVRV